MNFWSGHAGSSGSLVPIDQTAAVSGYFNSMLLPATFMTTQALNTLLKLKVNKNDVDENDSDIRVLLIQVTQFLITMAFMTAITSVVSGTSASVKILHGGFNPMAVTPFDLLVRNFEFEYVSVRWTFLTSIFCFLIGMGSQGVVQFNLLDPGKERMLAMFVGTLTSVTCYLISYVNNNIFEYGSLLGMTAHFVKLIFLEAKKAEPMTIMFMVSTAITAVLFMQMILTPLMKFLPISNSGSSKATNGSKRKRWPAP